MNGSAIDAASFESCGWPASFVSAFAASLTRTGSTTVRREVQVAEAHPIGLRERGAVLRVPGLELGPVGLARRADIFCQELHLLRHAALDDRVVLVEAHRQRFAVEDLFLHPVLDQAR